MSDTAARPFVFSCDAHIAEPPDLFVKAMPEHLQQFVIRSASDGDLRITKIGEQVILKIQTNFHQHKTGEGDAAFNAAALRRLLLGERGAYRDAVLLNAAGALIVAGEARDWHEGAEEAAEALDKGLAKALLDCWIDTVG